MAYIHALLSLRVWGLGLLAAIGVAAVGAPSGVILLALFGVPALFVLGAGTAPTTCPHCHKRVKLGATVCRFCGRDTA